MKTEKKEVKKICIYHANCTDGFGAAWVVRKALGEIEFHAGKYQEPPPDVKGKDVIIVDFSYKRDVLIEMSQTANSIVVLDHHKTAAEDLVDLPENVTAVFDMERSGCMIAWDHFFTDQGAPELLLCIQDRDLWRFKLDCTREVMACVFSHPQDFQIWDKLISSSLHDLAKEGKAIQRKHAKDLEVLLELTKRDMVIAGHRVPAANLPPTMASDAGNIMCRDWNGDFWQDGVTPGWSPFAATYYDTKDGRVFSLRSTENGLDVSEIAKQYGGGGHRNAAGFKVGFDKAYEFECQDQYFT